MCVFKQMLNAKGVYFKQHYFDCILLDIDCNNFKHVNAMILIFLVEEFAAVVVE